MIDGREISPPSVLLGFTAKNARSFRDGFDFDLEAHTTGNPAVARDVPWRDGGRTLRVLPAAAVFGPNGSGKSALLKVMHDLRRLVLGSFRHADPVGRIPRRPFVLDERSEEQPTEYEVDFIVGGVRHRFGCVVDDETVQREWAYRMPHGREQLLFLRRGSRVDLGPSARREGTPVTQLLRPNALFLSTAAATNHSALLPLYSWFTRNLILAEADSRPHRQMMTVEALADPVLSTATQTLLQAADLGVSGARPRSVGPEEQDRARRLLQVLFEGNDQAPSDDAEVVIGDRVELIHRGEGGDKTLPFRDESLGTKVWLGLVGPVLTALRDGTCLLADELDASLHPHLVRRVIELFQDPESNPRRAQLLFNSHDVSLLSREGDFQLGRDQIWLSEKNSDGVTRVSPLTDQQPRKAEPVEARYRAGRYGATPLVTHGEFRGAVETMLKTRGET